MKYLFALIILVSVNILPLYGFLSMDSFVQRLSQIKTSKNLEKSSSDQASENIFLETLNNLSANDSQAILNSFSSTQQVISKYAQVNNYSCALQNSDIFTILSSSSEFLRQLYTTSTIPFSQTIEQSSSKLKSSCQRMLSCLGSIPQNQIITDTPRQVSLCQTLTRNYYESQHILDASLSSLPLANNNDSIYMDNIKDNALFDLMIDISNIEKLLFDPAVESPDMPTMIYYSLPTVSIPSGASSPNGNTFSSGPSVYTPGSPQITTQVGSSILNNNGNAVASGKNTSSLISQEFTTFLQANTSVSTTPLFSTLGGAANTTVSQAICIAQDSEGPFSGTIAVSSHQNLEQTNIIAQFTQVQQELINALSGYLYTPPLSSHNNQTSGNNFGQNFISSIGALPSTTAQCSETCADTQGTEKMICEGKCCMASCNQLFNPSDKAVCLSQCLCGEASTANDMLRIKICRVPAQPSRIIAGKTIHSIEEGVNEINEIFQALKTNGALIKRTKTQEFLDSSFSSIKLHKILAFDIFVAIKPIYDKLQLPQAKKQSKATHDTIAQINNSQGTIGKASDKNKYNISGLEGSLEYKHQYCDSQGASYDEALQRCVPLSSTTKILQDLSSHLFITTSNDKIGEFLSENLVFRQEVYNQITNIQLSSQNLREKAEQAQ